MRDQFGAVKVEKIQTPIPDPIPDTPEVNMYHVTMLILVVTVVSIMLCVAMIV